MVFRETMFNQSGKNEMIIIALCLLLQALIIFKVIFSQSNHWKYMYNKIFI